MMRYDENDFDELYKLLESVRPPSILEDYFDDQFYEDFKDDFIKSLDRDSLINLIKETERLTDHLLTESKLPFKQKIHRKRTQ